MKDQSEERGLIPAGQRVIRPSGQSRLPANWRRVSGLDDWRDRLEEMLYHSAMLTGASSETAEIQGLAASYAPILSGQMTLDELDLAYMRWTATRMTEPDRPSVKVSAAELLAAWNAVKADEASRKAKEAEHAALNYKARVEASLRLRPRKLTSIAELAARDGVALPWTPGMPEEPARKPMSEDEWQAAQNERDQEEAERVARAEHNREIWHRFAAEAARLDAERTDKKTKEGKTDENA